MLEKDGRLSPSKWRIVVVVVFGGLAVAAGVSTSVGRVVLAIGAVVLVLVTGVGFAAQRHIKRKFPPVPFDRRDVSRVKQMIDSAGSRLAAGDAAAFAIHTSGDDSGDAEGQIWLFAAEDGVLERVAIELALPDSVDASHLPADLESLLREGWEVQASQPEWVVFTRSDEIDTGELVAVVMDSLTRLFDVPPGARWSCRASA